MFTIEPWRLRFVTQKGADAREKSARIPVEPQQRHKNARYDSGEGTDHVIAS